MNDPKRWLERPNDILSWEQRLLRSGRDLELPADAQDQAWCEFRALIGPLPGAGSNQSGPPHSGGSASSTAGHQGALTHTTSLGKSGLAHLMGAGSKVGITKILMITAAAVAGGSMAVLGDHLASRSQVPPIASIANARATAQPAATSRIVIQENMPAAAASSAPLSVAPRSPQRTVTEPEPYPAPIAPSPPIAQQPMDNEESTGVAAPVGTSMMPKVQEKAATTGQLAAAESPRLNELKAEAMAVAQAKNLISSGQFQAALPLLSQISQRFPNGALAPEREALTIEALAGSGSLPLAQQRAAVFLAQYPQSPLADKIRKFVRPR